jgi:hypothetical protein
LVVHQRARERRLHALALAEAIGAAVEQGAHVEHVGECFGAGVGRVALHSLEPAVINDVFARTQPWVQAARVREYAHACERISWASAHIDAVDADPSGVGRDEACQHAQGRRLAGAVRAEQAGDVAIGGVQIHVFHGLDDARRRALQREFSRATGRRAERLGEVFDVDHFEPSFTSVFAKSIG